MVVEMRMERDWLWKMAVPQLRRWCNEQHCLTLLLIDLPWDLHHAAAASPHHSSSSSSAAAAAAGWQKSLRTKEMLRCQTQSIGPDFVVCSFFLLVSADKIILQENMSTLSADIICDDSFFIRYYFISNTSNLYINNSERKEDHR